MANFSYTAKDFEGKAKSGDIVAQDEKSAAQQLRAEGLLVTSLKEKAEKEEKNGGLSFLERLFTVPLKEKMIFTRNLSVMIASGVTLSKAISNLSLQVQNKTFKKVLNIIYDDIQGGKSLSESLAVHPNIFSDLFINMIRVGETAGNLEEVLTILAEQLEKENDLRSKVKGALIYPAVILVAMAGVGVLMLTYILPKITGVFKDMEVGLPASTQFVIGLSDFLLNNFILLTILLIGLAIFLKYFLKTPSGKKTLSLIILNLPAIKHIVIKVNCARFSRIYSSLLKSGVTTVESLKIVSNTLGNFYYKKALKEGIDKIQRGVNLSEIIGENDKIFPIIVPQMIEVGEETGKTDIMLQKLAEFYEEEVNQITKNLSSIIEPVLMVLIGVAVGFFAVSMLQPMYSLMDNIQ